jgi:ATP/maltotriose-dependent transcriptional regulator MalT
VGDLTRAIDIGEAELRDAPEDDENRIKVASTLMACYHRRGDTTSAYLLARDTIDRAERLGSPQARAAAYWNAALLAEERGERKAARTFTDRALALYGELNETRAAACLRVNAAWLLLRSAEPNVGEAKSLLERALADLLCVAQPVDIASAETELARCHLLQGDAEEATALATRAIERLGTDGARPEAARGRLVLADTFAALGRTDEAARQYEQATTELTRAASSREVAGLWREVADRLLAVGQTAEAVAAYQRAADAVGIVAEMPLPVTALLHGSQR